MRRDGFDDQLTKVLKEEMDIIYPSCKLKEKIYQDIENVEYNHTKREVLNMKRFTLKKLAVVAACLCLLVPTGLFAAGKITTYVSHSYRAGDNYSENWNDLASMKKKSGLDANVKKEFSNGYKFDGMQIIDTDGQDESGNTVESFKELDITYENGSKNTINCTITSPREEEEYRDADQEKTANGTIFKYYQDTYKFAPPNYKLTSQDQKLMEQENYFVSYGSDKVEIKKYSYVNWEKDGISYSLNTFDTNLSADEMLNMAMETLK